MRDKAIRPFHLLIAYYLVVLAFFTICRSVLILQNLSDFNPEELKLIASSYVQGFLFDTVVISYTLILPTLLCIVLYCGRWMNDFVRKSLKLYFNFAFLTLLVISISDLGYFEFYGSRLNSGIFSWMGSPLLVLKTILSDAHYWALLIATVVILLCFNFILSKFISRFLGGRYKAHQTIKMTALTVVFLGVLFLGLRGSVDFKNEPLEPKDALFSPFALVNNMTINGVFNFVHSLNSRKIEFLPNDMALSSVSKYLNYETSNLNYPLLRKQKADSTGVNKNLVLIILESFSANQTGLYGGQKGLTPFLDSLAKASVCYPNVYTSGVHTHNGLYSTLYGHPAILDRVGLREGALANLSYYGLPHILQEKGYSTNFLIGGDKNFDSMQAFLPKNGFDQLVSQDDFLDRDKITSWGVSDHVLYNNTIEIMDSVAALNQPFFMNYMTISTHTPWDLPKDSRIPVLTGDNKEDKSYAYADWAIKQFLDQLKDKPYYENTIFAFIADHGQRFDMVYSMPLAYHHTPFIIFDPSADSALWDDKVGMQIDVFPTLLGLMKIPFENNTLGVNLGEHTRPFVFFTADDKIGVLDKEHYYIENLNGFKALYKYQEKSTDNILSSNLEKASEMQHYAYTMLQTSAYTIENRKVCNPVSIIAQR